MTQETYKKLSNLGYTGSQDDSSKIAIDWLASSELLRIEPYWHFLGAPGGYSWSKSWEVFSDRIEVDCETWEELLDIALEGSVKDAFPD